MATSGQINTNTLYDSFFWVYWSQQSQDTATNKTKIYWSCGVTCGHSFYLNAIKMSAVTINGIQVYGGGTYSNFNKGEHRIAYGYMDIDHNQDGTKSFSIGGFTGWLYSNYNYSAGGQSYDLPQIPRQAKITAAADFTDLDNPTIEISNPGNVAMDVWLEPNPVSDHLCQRERITLTGGKYTWVLSEDERDALRSKCPGKSCPIRLGLYSHVGGAVYADYQDKTFTMAESDATRPSFRISTNKDSLDAPEQMGKTYTQGRSNVKVSFLNVTPKYGAGVQSYSVTVDGKTYSAVSSANEYFLASDVIQNAGTIEVVCTVTDTRGFRSEVRKSIEVKAYSKPLVVPISGENAILCYRSDGNGKRVGNSTSVWIKAKRSYHTLYCALQWRWKQAGGAWDDSKHIWSDLRSRTDPADEYSALVTGTFDKTKSYNIQIRAVDDFGEQDIKNFDVPTEDVALHLGKGGKNVSVGSYCDYAEDHTFHSEWKAIFDQDVIVHGGINGIYMATKRISETNKVLIQTQYDSFSGTNGNRQSIFLFGTANKLPVIGVGYVANGGETSWSGTDGVVFTAGSDGVLEVTLPTTAYDYFTIISANPISFA